MIILENTKEYKDTKLEIPVGIGVVQTESVKNFYNTSNADATSDDIVKDKTAYGKYGKLTGTLDLENEKEISYQDGYETGKTDGYAEGLDDGITDGRNHIIEEQSDANITASDVTLGKIGYSANNEKIVGTSEAITSIDVGVLGIKFGESSFTEVSSVFDFSNVTDMSNMFYSCGNIQTMPLLNTSNVTNMYGMFYSCSNLTSIPQFNTSKVTNMQRMFYGCSNLTSIPQFDTSNVTDMYRMFQGCSNLTSIPEFDLSGMTGSNSSCTQIFGTSNYVIDFGGFKDLGKAYQNSGNSYRDVLLQSQAKLSYQSCVNVINKVYDLTLKPDYTYTPKICFHATPYALLSADDIAIATAKGWIVQAG